MAEKSTYEEMERRLKDLEREALKRKHAEKTLRQSEEQYRTIFECTGTATIIGDEDTTIVMVNSEFENLSGFSKKEIEGKKSWTEFIVEGDLERLKEYHRLRRIDPDAAPRNHEFDFIDKHCNVKHIFATVAIIPGTKWGVSSFSDITERMLAEKALQESEKKYRELSITDGLTKLYNSRHFFDQLEKEIERAHRYTRSLSLLVLDIDNFKHYNDQYGHLEGDKVLARIGKTIREALRQTDSAYRYGGEEFTVILPETEDHEAWNVAERIRTTFEQEKFSPHFEEEVHMSVSIGGAQYSKREDLREFIKRADKNMYVAKSKGKNCVFFS